MSVRWAAVGLGGMGTRMAGAIAAAAGAELVAVCSRTAERAAAVADGLGAKAYSDYAELLEDAEVDAVYLATETHLHARHAVAAARAGKHVLVEKPMTLSVEDAAAMEEAAEEHGVRIGVGFHLRLHPVHAAIRELVDSERIGAPVFVQALWGFYSEHWSRESWKMDPQRAGAGSLAALGVHLIDLLRFVLGREVTEVVAFADGPGDHRPLEFLTATTLVFDGGAIGQLVSSRRLRNTDDSLTVYCEGARLRGVGALTTEPVGRLEIADAAGMEVREPELRDLYLLEAEACSRAILTGADFPASGVDGVRSVEILTAVLESARTGRALSLR